MNIKEYIIKTEIRRLRKECPDEEFVIFIDPELGQGGGEFLGCKIIAHRAIKNGQIIAVRKKDLYPFGEYKQEGKMTELEKLEKYLKENGYNYERKQEQKAYYNLNQIIVYDKEGQRQWDAICHRGSYGYEEGLLEIMGSIVKPGGDSVEGWLTAEDIIKRLEGK